MADRTEAGEYIRPRNPGGRTGSVFGVGETEVRRLERERRAYNKLRGKVNRDQVYRTLASIVAGAGGEDTKSIETKYGKPVYGTSRQEKANIGEQLQDLLKTAAALEGDRAKTRGELAKQRGLSYGKLFDLLKQGVSSEGSSRASTGSAANTAKMRAHLVGLEKAQKDINLILQPDNKSLNKSMSNWAGGLGSEWRKPGSAAPDGIIQSAFLDDLRAGQAQETGPANQLAFVERAVGAAGWQSAEEFERQLKSQIEGSNAKNPSATSLLGVLDKNRREQELGEARWVKEQGPMMTKAIRSQGVYGANIQEALLETMATINKMGLGKEGIDADFDAISADLDAKDSETGKSPIETEEDRLLALLASDQYSDPLNRARQQFYKDVEFRRLATGMTGVSDDELTERDLHLTFKALNQMQRQNRGKRTETSRANVKDAMRRFKAGEELDGVNPQDAPKPPPEKKTLSRFDQARAKVKAKAEANKSAEIATPSSAEYTGGQPAGDADVDQNLPTATSASEDGPPKMGTQTAGDPLIEGVKGDPELPAQYITEEDSIKVYQGGELVDTITLEDERFDTVSSSLLEKETAKEESVLGEPLPDVDADADAASAAAAYPAADVAADAAAGIPADLGEGRFGQGRDPEGDNLDIQFIADKYKDNRKKQLEAAQKLATSETTEEAEIDKIVMPEIIQADTEFVPSDERSTEGDPTFLEEAQKAARAKINAALSATAARSVIGKEESGIQALKDDPTSALNRMIKAAAVEAGSGRK